MDIEIFQVYSVAIDSKIVIERRRKHWLGTSEENFSFVSSIQIRDESGNRNNFEVLSFKNEKGKRNF